jgi:DNA-directed RNA polymerase subunit RPC12/RpoP
MAEFICVKCKYSHEVDGKYVGRIIACPECNHNNLVGAGSQPQPPQQTPQTDWFESLNFAYVAYPICFVLYCISAFAFLGSLACFYGAISMESVGLDVESEISTQIRSFKQTQYFSASIFGAVSSALIAGIAAAIHVLLEIMSNTSITMQYARQTSEAMTKLTRKRK